MFTENDILSYLARIRESGAFEADSLRDRLLKYLLETELKGDGDTLKAYIIGLDVFEKPETFDPSSDSSIRVMMGRLRTTISLFESSDFADTEIVVEIPKGTYRPNVTRRAKAVDTPAPPATPSAPSPSKRRPARPWLYAALGIAALFVAASYYLVQSPRADNKVALEFEPFTGDPQLAMQVGTTLRRALSRNQAITVAPDMAAGQFADETDFIVYGSVERQDDEAIMVSIELVSHNTNEIIWAKALELPDDIMLNSRVSQTLGSELRIRAFGASKSELEYRDPKTLTPEQLFVMATWVPGRDVGAAEWERRRVDLMSLALQKDPDFGAAHSVMADKLGYLANVDAQFDTPDMPEMVLYHLQRARDLAPLNPDVMFNVAQGLWQTGQINDSEAAMMRVLELDPGHDVARFLNKVIPYTCARPPEDVVRWATEFDQNLSSDNPIRWLTLTWISWMHVNRGEYEEALSFEARAALMFEIPFTFMRHAMLLNKLGLTEKAATILRAQQDTWPNVSPSHFAEVTYPRLCAEAPNGQEFIDNYAELAEAMQGKL